MSVAQFDSKHFNAQVFGEYINAIPKTRKDELVKSRVIAPNPKLQEYFKDQGGAVWGSIPYHGRIGGKAVNYDGATDITANRTETYLQSYVALGRANAWTEGDFSYDVTAGVDFMDQVAAQVNDYWDSENTDILLSVLKGVYASTATEEKKFVDAHTHDISGGEGEAAKVASTTLNTAMQKACGDHKGKFAMVFMHSTVATNLENQNLLTYIMQNDENGIQRPTGMATWNGKLVVICDTMPVETDESGEKFTTYVFGEGVINFEELPVKVPYEMDRNPSVNGGEDTLYSRERLVLCLNGISFTKKQMASNSPTNEELENGQNWALVDNGKTGAARKVIDHKSIAIARIISRG